jgi:hypothetical protein
MLHENPSLPNHILHPFGLLPSEIDTLVIYQMYIIINDTLDLQGNLMFTGSNYIVWSLLFYTGVEKSILITKMIFVYIVWSKSNIIVSLLHVAGVD